MRLKSLLKRLVDKIVKDALPAGLASILGGLLLTHFQLDRVPQPTTVKVTQASPEMMQLLRDEHGLIIDFVREQVASEKSRGSADQSGQRVTEASAPPAVQVAPSPVQRPIPVVALAAPKPAAPRSKNQVVGASLPAPALAQAQPADPVPQAAARTDDSLLAKTIGIKDQVVSVTQRAVSATIGVIPSWFGSLGDRIGGEGQSPRPPANLVSASWIVPSAADR
jgi:hypothetical protein